MVYQFVLVMVSWIMLNNLDFLIRIYKITYKGVKKRVAVTVGDNGFVVGANPVSF